MNGNLSSQEKLPEFNEQTNYVPVRKIITVNLPQCMLLLHLNAALTSFRSFWPVLASIS